MVATKFKSKYLEDFDTGFGTRFVQDLIMFEGQVWTGRFGACIILEMLGSH